MLNPHTHYGWKWNQVAIQWVWNNTLYIIIRQCALYRVFHATNVSYLWPSMSLMPAANSWNIPLGKWTFELVLRKWWVSRTFHKQTEWLVSTPWTECSSHNKNSNIHRVMHINNYFYITKARKPVTRTSKGAFAADTLDFYNTAGVTL